MPNLKCKKKLHLQYVLETIIPHHILVNRLKYYQISVVVVDSFFLFFFFLLWGAGWEVPCEIINKVNSDIWFPV